MSEEIHVERKLLGVNVSTPTPCRCPSRMVAQEAADHQPGPSPWLQKRLYEGASWLATFDGLHAANKANIRISTGLD